MAYDSKIVLRNLQHTKAVLLTLLVLVEDNEVCRLIHDEKLVAVVAFIKINTQVRITLVTYVRY